MTPKQIAAAAMSGVRELSYTGMIVMDKGDLLEIIREAAQHAFEEGVQVGRKQGVKAKPMLIKSSAVRPARDIPDESYDI